MKFNLKERFAIFVKKEKITTSVGLEPITFELEVHNASPLRNGGFISREDGNCSVYIVLNTALFFFSSIPNS